MRAASNNGKPNRGILLGFAILMCALLGVVMDGGPASAIDYNAEIRRLQTQNNTNAQNRAALQNTALTLEQKIAHLQASISTLEGQIAANEAKHAELIRQIEASTIRITQEQAILGQLIRQLYIDQDMDMLEQMAASNNLSEYVEKEQYNLSIQSKVDESVKRIQSMKKEQEEQKLLTEKLLADNRAIQSQLAGEKQEVTQLLAMNQQQQAAYTQTISTTNTQITELQRQQAEENLRFQREQARLAEEARRKAAASGGQAAAPPAQSQAPAGLRAINGRAYPYANAPWPNEIADRWGMYQRQCVSYTAWAVAASGRHMPYWGGRGNAKQWDDNARAAGIPVDGNPRVGDVAVRNAGTYGHVMYVEAVNGDGSINISQYNAAWTGQYSEARIFPGDLVFIHF